MNGVDFLYKALWLVILVFWVSVQVQACMREWFRLRTATLDQVTVLTEKTLELAQAVRQLSEEKKSVHELTGKEQVN